MPNPCHAVHLIYIYSKKILVFIHFMFMQSRKHLSSKKQICKISFARYSWHLRASGHYSWLSITKMKFLYPNHMFWHTKNQECRILLQLFVSYDYFVEVRWKYFKLFCPDFILFLVISWLLQYYITQKS